MTTNISRVSQSAGLVASPSSGVSLPGILAGDATLAALVAKPQSFPGAGGRPFTVDYAPALKALTPYVFDPRSAPGATATQGTWTLWGHFVIPKHERDSVAFIVTAEGSAYGSGTTKLQYSDGTQVEFKGKIIAMGIARDHKRKDSGSEGDECTTPITIHGKPGETVRLRYARLSIDDRGRIVGGGTPDDSIRGASGAYMGRQAVMQIGKGQHIISPQDYDSEYSAMVSYFFNGATNGKAPDLARFAKESAERYNRKT